MSAISDDEGNEADVVSRHLCGIVDIGSSGIRFSISSKAPHHARIMPCVFKDRVGVSLHDVQYEENTLKKIPIPKDIIREICAAMKRFKLICDDFGVLQSSVRVISTDTAKEALNSEEFLNAIYEGTGWEVELLSRDEEARIGVYGVASSFNTISGLVMDLGGVTTQLSWVKSSDGQILQSSTPVSLKYGSNTLSKRLKLEDRRALFLELKKAFKEAMIKIDIPDDMINDAKKNGGFDLWTRGGGFRGMGHLLLSEAEGYPIQTIINGFSCSYDEFVAVSDFLFLKGRIPGSPEKKIFKVTEAKAKQLPTVGFLMNAAFESFPKIKTIHFSEGGVREGVLYSILPRDIRAEDPLLIASRPYAPLLAEKYLNLLRTAIPENDIPDIICSRIAPALCNLAFVHASYPKELQPTAALHIATRGIIAGCHGLSHRTRALIGIALCNRWGGNIPEQEEKYMQALEELVLRDGDGVEARRIVWWTKYIGTIMYVICGVHPGGNIRDDVFDFYVMQTTQTTKDRLPRELRSVASTNLSRVQKHREFEIVVRISKDDLKTSASVRSRIITLQKKVRKLAFQRKP